MFIRYLSNNLLLNRNKGISKLVSSGYKCNFVALRRMTTANTGKVLWEPGELKDTCQMSNLMRHLNKRYVLNLENYDDLYQWSVDNIDMFWVEVLYHSQMELDRPYLRVVDKEASIESNPKWFEGAYLNYTKNILRYNDDKTSIVQYRESANYPGSEIIVNKKEITYKELNSAVKKLAMALKARGIQPGDRVVGIITNGIYGVVAMLATNSIGASWSCVGLDAQPHAIIMRIQQLKPKVLFVSPSSTYAGKSFAQMPKLPKILEQVDSIELVIAESLPYLEPELEKCLSGKLILYESLIANHSEDDFSYTSFPFDHPLAILFSSGTTGVPKGLVHSAGGTLLQHIKELVYHNNLNRDSVMLFYTIPTWMMFNWVASSLFTGCKIILYDGSPIYPNEHILWDICQKEGVTVFGSGAAFYQILEKRNIIVKDRNKLESLKTCLSTGSVLGDHTFGFIHENIKNVQIGSMSGGTDLMGCLVANNPMVPVVQGEIQRRCLAMALESYDYNDKGELVSVYDKAGELVCTKPFPSMPVYFWNDDKDRTLYKNAYFRKYPGVWSHGDFCQINSHNKGIVISGRSDSTLNPNGVRFGSSEIYSALNDYEDILDCIVVGQQLADIEKCILFVKLKDGLKLDSKINKSILDTIAQKLSRKHLPNSIFQVLDIPYTHTGKKMEILIKNICSRKIDAYNPKVNTDAMRNPECLDEYYNFVKSNVL